MCLRYLVAGCRGDGAALGGAGQGQGVGQLALSDGARAQSPAVAQRHRTHAPRRPSPRGGAPASALKQNTDDVSHTNNTGGRGCLGVLQGNMEIAATCSPTGSHPHRQTGLQTEIPLKNTTF